MQSTTKFLILFSSILLTVWTRTAEEWRTRTIYQIVTDRFGRTDDETIVCHDLTNYCGGTWKGIEKNLDYIQGIGADAIWISPVIKNKEGGYHGYWTTNLYELNSNFGTEQDLKDLINACHERDMYIMIDVVPNHVAPVPHDEDLKNYDFSGIFPFNDKKFYHWPSTPVCQFIDDNYPTNQTALEYCWLLDLPDLNHEDPYVTETLIDWVRDFVQTYNVDGLRLDAVRHIPKWFWKRFTEAAGVYTIGEVWNHDVPYCATYQEVMDSLMNFPFHGTLDQVFLQDLSMKLLTKHYEVGIEKWKDISVLGNFVVNHDFPRFLNTTPDMAIYKAYYTYVLTSVGIPIIYYGDEQSFTGGRDPLNRETMWGKMNPEAEMYQYIKSILDYKKKSKYHNDEQIERYVDDNFYAFSRGDSFFAFSNLDGVQTRKITTHPYSEDTWLCNVFSGKECVQVKNGEFEVTVINKQPQILAPHQVMEEGGHKHRHWKHLKAIWSSIFALQPQFKDFSFYKYYNK